MTTTKEFAEKCDLLDLCQPGYFTDSTRIIDIGSACYPRNKAKEAQNSVSMLQTAALKSARLAQSKRSRFKANFGELYKVKGQTSCFERMYIKYARPRIQYIQGVHCIVPFIQ